LVFTVHWEGLLFKWSKYYSFASVLLARTDVAFIDFVTIMSILGVRAGAVKKGLAETGQPFETRPNSQKKSALAARANKHQA
jgi:hypothetical protein